MGQPVNKHGPPVSGARPTWPRVSRARGARGAGELLTDTGLVLTGGRGGGAGVSYLCELLVSVTAVSH